MIVVSDLVGESLLPYMHNWIDKYIKKIDIPLVRDYKPPKPTILEELENKGI